MRRLHRAGVGHVDFTTRNILLKLQNLHELTPNNIQKFFGTIVSENSFQRMATTLKSQCQMGLFASYYARHSNEIFEVRTGRNRFRHVVLPFRPIRRRRRSIWLLRTRKNLGDKADIWSVACVIFEPRAGKPLFHTRTGNDDGVVYNMKETMVDI
jgi:hypothetical protein